MPARAPIAFCLGLLLWLLPQASMAAGPYQDRSLLPGVLPAEIDLAPSSRREPQRLVAATLTLAVGAFAAHRLYFGTDVKVPIAYGLTFGGFGVLVLIDLAHILFTKDLKAYMNNSKVLMWSSERSDPLTPP